MGAILYVEGTGVRRRYLAHDLPRWDTVYGYRLTGARGGVRPTQRTPSAAAVEEGATGRRTVGVCDCLSERQDLLQCPCR
ncbi:hypothetical protein [Streptomyces sp. NPDC005533]|uniref:hypothetical protein n=1 Tax=Streptomyces sp. NPDC005533 TaxID=3364723 RepID=UPI0036976522